MKEGDHQHLAAIFGDRFRGRPYGVRVERTQYPALCAHPLFHLVPVATVDQRLELAEQTVRLRSVTTPEFEDVPESAGGDETAASAFALDHGIGGDGCPMNDEVDGLNIYAKLIDAVHQTVGLVRGSRWHLGHPQVFGLRIDENEIRVRAADVDADQSRHLNFKKMSSIGIAIEGIVT